ncbi:MAG TPA: hypothetical protein VE135_25865 [Pyrinomonadaceae bacterium]|nr:hypothetical protein [Pyrinomonadaceae bacterium]
MEFTTAGPHRSNSAHVIFYIDILGFTSALEDPNESGFDTIKGLLSDFASMRGEFSIKDETPTGFSVRPAITTFSDLVVLSWPLAGIPKTNEALTEGVAFAVTVWRSSVFISALASAAIKLGFLIRGGATVGQLHHEKDIVMGRALNEAYELERRVANYPRIVVSSKLYSRVTVDPGLLKTDRDGIVHLNYLQAMILSGGGEGNEALWLANVRRIVKENRDKFEGSGRLNQLAKWAWFEAELEDEVSRLPSAT